MAQCRKALATKPYSISGIHMIVGEKRTPPCCLFYICTWGMTCISPLTNKCNRSFIFMKQAVQYDEKTLKKKQLIESRTHVNELFFRDQAVISLIPTTSGIKEIPLNTIKTFKSKLFSVEMSLNGAWLLLCVYWKIIQSCPDSAYHRSSCK